MAAAVSATPLPQRLMNFFARYPPQLYSAKYTGQTIPIARRSPKDFKQQTSATISSSDHSPAVAPNTSPEDPNAPGVIATAIPPKDKAHHNPFLPRKNFATGRWSGAKIGLRRQADLVKLAKAHGVEPLLPPGRKSSAFKEQRLLEGGLRVKGTGEGQKVKGHKSERRMGVTVEKRIKAMEEMPELIRVWKQRGHGRGWKKYPK